MVRVGKLIFDKGWIAANDGNFSVRLEDGRILATPTGVSKGMMDPGDLIICDADGRKLTGEREITSEMAMHLPIYPLPPHIPPPAHPHPPLPPCLPAPRH